jgi:hypothetical protein
MVDRGSMGKVRYRLQRDLQYIIHGACLIPGISETGVLAMNKSLTQGGFRAAVVFGALALVWPTGAVLPIRADEQPAAEAKEPTKLAKNLIGTWVLVGTPDKVGETPTSGGRLKFFTGKHWVITQADPNTDKVVFHHGGTYTLDGDNYAETIEYANENTANLVKKTFQFKIKVDGDTYTQIGVGDDNPFSEVWKRVK